MVEWYFTSQGVQHGPVPLEAMQEMYRTGQLPPYENVWRAGMASWLPAASVPELEAPPVTPHYGPQRDIGQDAGIRMLLPVGRSGWAIAAGYAGLFAFIILPAPLALILSIIAFVDMRKHPEKHGMGRAIFGLITGLLGTGILMFAMVAKIMR